MIQNRRLISWRHLGEIIARQGNGTSLFCECRVAASRLD
jgi:hypothetical protein